MLFFCIQNHTYFLVQYEIFQIEKEKKFMGMLDLQALNMSTKYGGIFFFQTNIFSDFV